MGSLEGKVAVVTGSGRGIGRAAALLFGKQGAKVVVNDLGGDRHGQGVSNTPADEVVAEIKANGGEAVACHDTVATMEGGENIVNTAINTYGKIDILVNNAGILRDRMTFNMTEDEWDGVIATHLKGCFTTTRAASPYMRQQKSGRIICLTSDSARGSIGQVNYSAAKAGILGFIRTVAKDMGKYGVTANAVAPAAITRMTSDLDSQKPPSARTSEGDGSGMPETSGPETIAPVICYLATDEAQFINGQVLGVNGPRVSLWINPGPVSSAFNANGVWTVEELIATVPGTIAWNQTTQPTDLNI
jgi:NAD(P)-dependent dehydrogenase (short-subunit alcohol dehydrogenase family)